MTKKTPDGPRSSVTQRTVLILAGVFATGSIAYGAEPDTVTVQIVDEGEFEVILARAERWTMNLMYSIPHNANRKESDTEREVEIAAFLQEAGCVEEFTKAMTARFQHYGVAVEFISEARGRDEDANADVGIRIRNCGFRIMDRQAEHLAAHYEFSFWLSGDDPETQARNVIITGSHRASWEDFLALPVLAADEFEEVTVRAGKRVADKVVYGESR